MLPVLRATAALTALLLAGALSVACEGDNLATQEQDKSPAATTTGMSQTPTGTDGGQDFAAVPEGVWAGRHLVLTVTGSGATAEFDCADGVATEPLSLNDDGRFDVAAEHTVHSGGPASTNDTRAPPLSARYRGRLIDAQHLTLTVELSDSGESFGPLELELGGEESLERCV